MRFKKRSAAAIALVATVVALAGCSGGSSSGDQDAKVTSINYWYWQDDTTDQTVNNLADEFKKKTGITVHIQDSIAQPQFYDKLVNAIASGNGPDATHLNTNMTGQLIQNHVLAPLDDRIKSWPGEKDVIPSMWSYVKGPDGKTTYAIPNKYLMFFLYYRKDIFKAQGIQVPKTQVEFVEAAKKAYKPSKKQYGFDIRGGANGQDQWAAFLVAGGAKFLDGSGKVVFDSAAARKANDTYISTYKYAPPGAINDGLPQLISNFKSGAATMVINHLGLAKTLDQALGSGKVGVAPVPSLTGDMSNTTYMGTMNMNAVLASSKKQAAAFKWITFLAEKKAQLAITKSTNGYLPVVQSVSGDPQFKDNQYMNISSKEAANSVTAWPAVPGTTAATTTVWQPLFQGALLHKKSNDEVVSGVANALKKGK